MNLTAVRLLAPHLTADNHRELLAAAAGRSKRQVEELVALRFPRPDVAASIRKLPVARSMAMPVPAVVADAEQTSATAREVSAVVAATSQSVASLAPAPDPSTAQSLTGAPTRVPPPPPRPLVIPLAADRYQIRFTASAATWEKLRLAQDLLRHAVPSGDPAEIVDRALTLLIDDLAKKKCAAVKTPRRRGRPTAAGSRHLPAKVQRVVWIRDQGRCKFVAGSGRRCKERGFLEFHHVEPYAVGGPPTVANTQLRCRAHNGYEAVLFYGFSGPRGEAVVKERSVAYGLSPEDATRSGTSTAPGTSARLRGARSG